MSLRASLLPGAILLTLISACGSVEKAESDAAVCDNVISSFATVPITRETQVQALERLEVIKIEQERSFADRCDKIPGWREKFDAAYEEARAATGILVIDTVEAPLADEQ
ncbi:MAG: hypothetical protein WD076_06440 [Parvularculaceae bacterium]